MTERQGGRLILGEEDRLPWLEPVAPAEEDPVSPVSLVAFVIAGLALIALIVGGIWWYMNRAEPGGDGTLIAAPPGPYKVKPDTPGGMEVEGQGDAVPAATEGIDPEGRLDMDAVPETPVATPTPTPTPTPLPTRTPTPKPGGVSAQVPDSSGRLTAPAPLRRAARPRAPGSASGGSLIQLGAFGSAAEANSAWTRISRRFAWIAPLNKQVVAVEVDGRTLHRLRVAAASHADAVSACKRLKVAGQDCLIAAQ
ncbi:SPOR domain-containing protein [Sphingomonas sanxanigenens]|uniref:SPOR domain-containing protein n=1 Tax=Sphingomonas sanxanigenens DSM 19645 = NX02 TaxID=1123269 RepID=W0A1R7_9SPHN|nr:SPOR domain-containing protein [Sphingomonas sanxanigenens]AHE51879.1 hypothetical protein NX02_00555 [Sphingomonas sanxanigenens DSM 19645 = NX02]